MRAYDALVLAFYKWAKENGYKPFKPSLQATKKYHPDTAIAVIPGDKPLVIRGVVERLGRPR
jgi:hypothetical protein